MTDDEYKSGPKDPLKLCQVIILSLLNIHKIRKLCRKHKMKQIFVFGSILTDRFNDESGVDLLVDFNSEIDYHNVWDYAHDLFSIPKKIPQ